LLVDLPGSAQASVLVLAPYPAQGQGQRQARVGALATAVLGAGYSSRINQQVRIQRGLSYGAYSSATSLPAGGLLTLNAQTQAQSAAEVAMLLREELLRLSEEAVPADELLARQNGLIGEFSRQLETTQELAALAADQLERDQPLADLARFADELKAVDADQLLAFAKQHWPAQAVRSVVVGDLALAGEALRRQFPQACVIPAAELDLASPHLRRQRIK
jgi:zinc protease